MSFLYGFTLLAGVVCLPLLIAPRSWNVGLVRWWCGVVLGGHKHIIGVEYVIKGKENVPEGPFILAAKHQAMWETLMVNRMLRDPAIVLKKELMIIPIFGWWAWKMRMIAIDRATRASALRKMMGAAKTEAEKGRPLVIFPEGTRKTPGDPPDYKPGTVAMYRALKIPVVPAALNSGRVWPRKGFGFKPGVITFEFLPPIEPGLGKPEFNAELEKRIEESTTRLNEL